jgi:dUTP pyrophosphatase
MPRSGKGASEGLVLANLTGLIDLADYRGEIIAAVWNRNSVQNVKIKPGEKIVQMMIVPYWLPEWNIVTELPESVRGHGGFGSTSI